ncbi:MAG: phytoene desaturase family protein [Thermodesulfobacteriota bacterium]|nr:phytoene desaturase family protein [Thermodesulfobacteriota bacterium]
MANIKSKRVAVIGGGLGGLSTAIHLSLRGFKVTLFESNEKVGGRANQIKSDGFTFDTGPTLLNYPWVFDELFNTAGCRLEDFVDLIPVDPSILFLWPSGNNIQLTSNFTSLVKEFERVDKGSCPGLFAFLADAAEKYNISFDKLVCRNIDNPVRWLGSLKLLEMIRIGIWRSMDRELARFFKNRFIREALGSYGMYLGGSPQHLPGIFSILPYGEIAMGLWLPRGGIYTLVQAMDALASKSGVDILTEQYVKQIRIRDGRVTGLSLRNAKVVECPIVVSNVDVPTTQYRLLSENGYRPSRTLKMTPSVMTFYWGINKMIEGASHHTIFMPGNTSRAYNELIKQLRIPDEMPFYMSVASKTDPSLAPPGCSTVFVLVPLPQSVKTNSKNGSLSTEQIKSRIMERLNLHGIRISDSDIVNEKVLIPSDWGKRFGLFQDSAFGAAHTLFQMGSFRYPNKDRNLSGLYYTGASTTPGTGMPMVVLSGKMTAKRICDDVC